MASEHFGTAQKSTSHPTENRVSVGSFEGLVRRRIGQRNKEPGLTQNTMLTFFDYLRRRAYESVLSGVHEALESLEKEDHQTASPKNQPAQLTPSPTAAPNKSEKAGKVLPPRRRGRPPKKQDPKP